MILLYGGDADHDVSLYREFPNAEECLKNFANWDKFDQGVFQEFLKDPKFGQTLLYKGLLLVVTLDGYQC